MLRRLAREGKSQRQALEEFRARGKRRISNELFRGIYNALRAAVREGIRLANLNKVRYGSRGRQGFGVEAGDVKQVIKGIGLSNLKAIEVTATGYGVGTAVASIGNRQYDVPYQTRSVTVKFRLTGLERLTAGRAIERRITIATQNAQYEAAVRALKAADENFAEVALQYGRVQVKRGGDAVVTKVTTRPIK